MTDAAETSRMVGRNAGRLLALLSALIVLALGWAWFGTTAVRMPFAPMLVFAVAATVVYAVLMWRTMALTDNGLSWPGALVAGVGAPLIGAFALDVMLVLHSGSGDAAARSLLLAYWPLGVAAALAGAVAALVAAALARWGVARRAVPGIRLD